MLTLKTLNMSFKYPGIEIYAEMELLKIYLSHLKVGIEEIRQQYIFSEFSGLSSNEESYKSQVIEISEKELPRIVKLPYVISIYTIYENSINQIINYLSEAEKKGIRLSDLEGQKSITAKYNKYLKYILEYEFQFSNRFMQEISEITKIRNCIAHANGNIEALSDSKRNEIEKIVSAGRGVSINHFKIDVTFEYLNLITNIIFTEIERFMTYVEEEST